MHCLMDDQPPLTSITVGRVVRLSKINAGRRLVHRLTELGLTPGVELKVIQDNGGPLLIYVRGSRIAIGRGIASKIQVSLINNHRGSQKHSTSTLVS